MYQFDNKRQNQYNLIFSWKDTDWILYSKILYHDFSIFPVLYQLIQYKRYIFDTIFIHINFTISKTDMIFFFNLNIAYVFHLAHACCINISLLQIDLLLIVSHYLQNITLVPWREWNIIKFSKLPLFILHLFD